VELDGEDDAQQRGQEMMGRLGNHDCEGLSSAA
jgi:hypothetical protein